MRKIIIPLVIQFIVICTLSAQDVKNGYIISKETYVFGYTFKEGDFRFTPSKDDVEKAESIIMSNKDYIRRQPNAQSGRDIFRSYRRYFKQYVGAIGPEGERLILINYIDNCRKINDSEKQELIYIIDGGNSFWNALINLDKGTIITVSINGPG